MKLKESEVKELKDQYNHNLQRLDKAEAYFNTLNDDEYKKNRSFKAI